MSKVKRKRSLDDIYEDMYLSVQQYVEHFGGRIAVIGGVEVQQWPDDLTHTFRIAIRCTGKKPELKARPQ